MIAGHTSGNLVRVQTAPGFLVRDAETKQCLRHVEISFWSMDGRQRYCVFDSNARDGLHYVLAPRELERLGVVRANVVIRADGYSALSRPWAWVKAASPFAIEMMRGTNATLEVRGHRPGAAIEVRCTCIASGEGTGPCFGFGYLVRDSVDPILRGVPSGQYVVRTVDLDGNPVTWSGEVVEHTVAKVGRSATGEVSVDVGESLGGDVRRVILSQGSVEELSPVESRQTWTSARVDPGEYRLSVLGPGGEIPVADTVSGVTLTHVIVEPGKRTEVSVEAAVPHDVLEITGEGGVPVAGASVKWGGQHVMTDARGRVIGWGNGDSGLVSVVWQGVSRTIEWVRAGHVCRAKWGELGDRLSITVEVDDQVVRADEGTVFVVDGDNRWEQAAEESGRWSFAMSDGGPWKVVLDRSGGDRVVWEGVVDGASLQVALPEIREFKDVDLDLTGRDDCLLDLGLELRGSVWFYTGGQFRLHGGHVHRIRLPGTGHVIADLQRWGARGSERRRWNCDSFEPGTTVVW